jgi:hypothetical protein
MSTRFCSEESELLGRLGHGWWTIHHKCCRMDVSGSEWGSVADFS